VCYKLNVRDRNQKLGMKQNIIHIVFFTFYTLYFFYSSNDEYFYLAFIMLCSTIHDHISIDTLILFFVTIEFIIKSLQLLLFFILFSLYVIYGYLSSVISIIVIFPSTIKYSSYFLLNFKHIFVLLIHIYFLFFIGTQEINKA